MFFVNYMMVYLFCYEMIIISRGFCTCTAVKAIEQPSVTFVKNIVRLLYFGKILGYLLFYGTERNGTPVP